MKYVIYLLAAAAVGNAARSAARYYRVKAQGATAEELGRTSLD